MSAESKKLQTIYENGEAWAVGNEQEYQHDARIAHEQREVIRKAHELVGFVLCAAEDQVSINVELGQTHEERERRKVQLLRFIRHNLDKVIDLAEPFMAAAAPFLED